ncbi:ABC transporter substrate-binding protein [Desulfuribacillus alkaliarsenatis]|uniref:Fe/B12 periplasmic-binding domain-containing protein n=1 Tax=Desulfuribacillus alkaliarsenatis TaxID=766136 RepID=A0A1E5FZM9_9FIRM|nr:ABC transporter substrate-binding protein [Desulfuribacillus alkaliarsenatis]OEF95908.1 hypothetical protein BHF68_10990 [Desulfuribacillus alkaliarsenatis]
MKTNKLYITLLLVFILTIMTACMSEPTANESVEPNNSTNGQSTTIENEVEGPRIVVDSIGRQVEVPADAQRIAALFPTPAYTATMLGKGDMLVATPNGVQRDKMMRILVPGITEVAVPKRSGVINIEELLNANPDVIFIDMQSAINEAEIAKLDLIDIPYIVVEFNSMEEQMQAISIIGAAINRLEEAEAFNQYYEDMIEFVRSVTSTIPEAERVRIYHSVNDATRTAATGTLMADWSKAAGAINVSVGEDLRETEDEFYATIEQILLWNPQVVFANEHRVVSYVRENEHWAPIDAVINDRVYKMPHGLSRWGHPNALETPLVTLWAAQTLYPNYFQDISMEQEIYDFFDRFFNYQLTADDIEDVLTGDGMRDAKGQ